MSQSDSELKFEPKIQCEIYEEQMAESRPEIFIKEKKSSLAQGPYLQDYYKVSEIRVRDIATTISSCSSSKNEWKMYL